MKRRIRQIFFLGPMLLIAVFIGIPTPVFAAGETIFLTPSAGLSQPTYTFIISVDGHVGNVGTWGVSGATGTITFPANLLEVTNVSSGGSTLPTSTVTPNNTDGKITFNQSIYFAQGVKNQDIHLFTITFKSLADGKANVNFESVQYMTGYPSASTGPVASTGGVYTISTPQPSVSPTPSVSPSPQQKVSTPSPSPIPTPTPEETPAPINVSDGGLKIDNVRVVANRQENSVSWTLNNDSIAPEFRYGTSKGSQNSKADAVIQTDKSYLTKLTDLKAGTLYYFTIKAATTDGLQGATYIGTFTTRGYPVQLTIQQNGLSVSNAKVKINERTFTSNENAIITTELPDGLHNASITPHGSNQSYPVTFTVAKLPLENDTPDLQIFTLNITTIGKSTRSGTSLLLPLIAGGVIAVIAIGGILGYVLLRRRNSINNQMSTDSDLLASTYGDAIKNYRNNTPQPNLDTVNIPQLGSASPDYQAIAEEVPPLAPPAAAPPPLATEDTNTAPVLSTATTTDPTPATVPLPPMQEVMTDVPMEQPGNEPTPAEAYQNEALSPELSPELTQVEASQQIEAVSNEPSAVYDESTGELEILHHHTAHATPPAAATSTSVKQSVAPAPSSTIEAAPPATPRPQQPLTAPPHT